MKAGPAEWDLDALHLQWMEAGGDADRFWRLTPRETKREIAAHITRQKREYTERAWLAYHIAALPRLKRFPDFRNFVKPPGEEARAQPWQEQLAIAMRWAAAVKRL